MLLLCDGLRELVELLLVFAPLQRPDAFDVQPAVNLLDGYYRRPVVLTAYVYSEPCSASVCRNAVCLFNKLWVEHRLEAILEDAFVLLGEHFFVRA